MQLFKKISDILDTAENGQGDHPRHAAGVGRPCASGENVHPSSSSSLVPPSSSLGGRRSPSPRQAEYAAASDLSVSEFMRPADVKNVAAVEAQKTPSHVPDFAGVRETASLALSSSGIATAAPGPTRNAGGDWEVVANSVSASVGEGDGTAKTPRLRATDALAEEAARIFRSAAAAAEALAPRLSAALRRAEVAETEVLRLRTALEMAETRIKELEKQQEQLTQGFVMEIRQRDAEIATCRAAATPRTTIAQAEREASCLCPTPGCTRPAWNSQPGYTCCRTCERNAGTAHGQECNRKFRAAVAQAEAAEAIDIVTFTAEGPLGVEFDQTNSVLKFVSCVDPGSQAAGRLFVGDEVVSVSGISARNLSWEELHDVLSPRPAVVSVRRAEPLSPEGANPNSGPAGPVNPLGQRLRMIAGFGGAAVRAVRGVMAEMADAEDQDPDRRAGEEEMPDDDLPTEVRNRPFYELVRSSMAEACSLETADPGSGGTCVNEEVNFERWLRQFHNERDDEWYASNHVRVYNAFKPHWNEVVEAQRALAAS